MSSISTKIEPHTAYIREELLKSAVVHADETRMRIEDKMHWLHTVSSSDWTLYHVHEKRGKIAIKDHDVLPKYHGILVHDCWASYFTADYSFDHALCGAHLLRECQGIINYDGHQWAADMKELLQEACHHKKKWRLEDIPIKGADALEWEMRYIRILERGAKEWVTDPVVDAPLKRGRKKKSKAANLATRFLLHKTAILRFVRDARVPFDNSQAERDIRMMKVKQKVSGHFRTLEVAKQFAKIHGFISTLRKQGRDILSSLLSVTRGEFSFK
ncbi:IS66 family transposase [Sporosarcina sp. FSL K6-3457]|uniref:IS66 family transposase n=1 Tax=Sporosarcina sp. FSL K6-3457 TaxID=2978204 RepID=UPI004046E50A